MDEMSWEERMSQRARCAAGYGPDHILADEPNTPEKIWARLEDWQKSPVPPDEDECRECYEWRPYPGVQAHFGYTWWRTCDLVACQHEHHNNEVWIA